MKFTQTRIAITSLFLLSLLACSNELGEDVASTSSELTDVEDGKIDAFDEVQGIASGWARVRYYPGRVVTAHLYVDRVWFDAVPATASGNDLDTLHVGNLIVHSFSSMLPDEALDGKPHDISLKITIDDSGRTGGDGANPNPNPNPNPTPGPTKTPTSCTLRTVAGQSSCTLVCNSNAKVSYTGNDQGIGSGFIGFMPQGSSKLIVTVNPAATNLRAVTVTIKGECTR